MFKLNVFLLFFSIMICSCEKRLQKSEYLHPEKHDTSYLEYADVPNDVFDEGSMIAFDTFFDSLTWLCFHPEMMNDLESAEKFLTKYDLEFEKKKNVNFGCIELSLYLWHHKENRKVRMHYRYHVLTQQYLSILHDVESIPDEERNRFVDNFSQWINQQVNLQYQKFTKRNKDGQLYSLGYGWDMTKKGAKSQIIFTIWEKNNSIHIERKNQLEVSFAQNVE